MDPQFVFRGEASGSRIVTFSNVQQPHDDSLTLFLVEFEADGLKAVCPVESLDGDEGFDADATDSDGGIERRTAVRLSDFLRMLGHSQRWEGERTWSSLTAALKVYASVDEVGHVTLDFEVAPQSWDSSWLARCTLRYDLGDLVGLGNQLRAWFNAQIN